MLSVWSCCSRYGHVVVSVLSSPPPCGCRWRRWHGVGVVKVAEGMRQPHAATATSCNLPKTKQKTFSSQKMPVHHMESKRAKNTLTALMCFPKLFMSYTTLFPFSFPANDKPDHCAAPDTSHPDGTIPSAEFAACPRPHAHQLTQQR